MTDDKKAPKKAITFLPHGHSKTCEEEKAYRRGFDQGLCAGLRLAGFSDSQMEELEYKQRITEWRQNRLEIPDPMKPYGYEIINTWSAVRKLVLMTMLNMPARAEVFARIKP